MTKAAKKTTLTEEQEAFLASRKSESQEQQDRVFLPTIGVKGDGFVLKNGENTENFSKFSIRVLDVYFKFIRRGGKATNFAAEAETIMVRHGEKKAFIDTLGTTNCGKVPSYAIPAGWSEAQKEANNDKATFYAIVYGVVKGEIVRFQVPSAKAGHILQFFKELGVEDPAQVEMEVSLDKSGKLVTKATSTDLSVVEVMSEIKDVVYPEVERANSWVESQYKKMRGENATAEDILDDEIPF